MFGSTNVPGGGVAVAVDSGKGVIVERADVAVAATLSAVLVAAGVSVAVGCGSGVGPEPQPGR
jgi:hypothetical protein